MSSRPLVRLSQNAQAMCLALIPMVALGFARFAYGSILPSMRSDLGWTYRLAAVPTFANGVGYLVGSLTGALVVARLGVVRVALASLAVTAVAVAATAGFDGAVSISILRLVAGASGAWAYVAGAVAATSLHEVGVRMATAWYPAGAGAGVVIAALIGFWLDDGQADWERAWLIMGVAGLLAGGLVAAAMIQLRAVVPPQRSARVGGFRLVGWRITAGYGLFGAGYIGLATFGTSHLADRGLPVVATQWFWVVVGVSILVSGPLWVPYMERAAGGFPLASPIAGCAVAGLALLLPVSMPIALVAATLLGGCVLNTTAGVTRIIHRDLGRAEWGRAFAAITAAFAIGQMLGPLVALVVGDRPATGSAILLASTALLAAGAAAAAHGAMRHRADGAATRTWSTGGETER